MKLVVLAALSLAATPAFAQTPPPPAAPAPVDYASAANWICLPGRDDVCSRPQPTADLNPNGYGPVMPSAVAADPPIDCFYVYPTVSKEPTVYASMAASPEVRQVGRAQAGRLASRCRLFVPIYRQRTGAGIADTAHNREWDWSGPYGDVLAAWRWYLAHDNHGRGVVLVGHSQGTLLLQKLIAAEIDGKPVQGQLVSAFLAGDQELLVPQGARTGGTFKQVPLCAAAVETGCVYVWGSYLAGDDQPVRFFGNNRDGLMAACASPAAPGGGAGALKSYFPKPAMAPADDPPWVEVVGQLSASCAADDRGNVLRVAVLPSRFAPLLDSLLHKGSAEPKWGLHRFDISFVQGNILELIDAQTASWMKHHPGAAR